MKMYVNIFWMVLMIISNFVTIKFDTQEYFFILCDQKKETKMAKMSWHSLQTTLIHLNHMIRSQEHILGFATCLYDYVLIRKDICD
jgi:hypothetical protein